VIGDERLSAHTPERHAQIVRLRPEKREEYLRLHAAVWPEVEARITASNIINYSIFVVGDLLLAYFEYIGSDFEADMALMAEDPATQRWWQLTDPCQEPLADAATGSIWTDAAEIWHLS
jgi:L-rhamnose mutarotase